MSTFTPDPADGERVYDLDRAHVFHSWSAQGALNPCSSPAPQGCEVWDYDGNRFLDFSSQLVNTNIGHQHPQVVAAIQDAGRQAHDGRAAARQPRPRRGREAHRRPRARRLQQGLLHQRRRRRQRERDPHGAPAHRPRQGAVVLPQLPRQHRCGDRRHRRLASRAQRVRRRPRALLRPLPLPLLVLGRPPRAGVRARARTTSSRSSPSRARRRSPRSCSRPSPAPPACSIPPPGYLEGVRALCDKYGIVLILDEVMCGFGRTGEWFAFENFGVVPDLITFAKGSTPATCRSAA